MPDDLLTTSEIAAALGVTRKAVLAWARRRGLKPVKLGPRFYQFSLAEAREVQATPKKRGPKPRNG